MPDDSTPLPQDVFSRRLRELRANPAAVEKNSRVELSDFYGNLETWNVKTISHDSAATVFIERGTAGGGDRWVLPPEVAAALYRHKGGITAVNVKRGAKAAAATRQAAGVKPFVKKTEAK